MKKFDPDDFPDIAWDEFMAAAVTLFVRDNVKPVIIIGIADTGAVCHLMSEGADGWEMVEMLDEVIQQVKRVTKENGEIDPGFAK